MLQPIELIVDNRRALNDFRRYTMEEVKSITVAQARDIMDEKRRGIACLKPKEIFTPTAPTGGYIHIPPSLPVSMAAQAAKQDGYACLPLLP